MFPIDPHAGCLGSRCGSYEDRTMRNKNTALLPLLAAGMLALVTLALIVQPAVALAVAPILWALAALIRAVRGEPIDEAPPEVSATSPRPDHLPELPDTGATERST
jgi:hypothetical protein